MKINRIPLEYPEIPGDVNPNEFKSEIRAIHQAYCAAMMEVEKQAMQAAQKISDSYTDSVQDYVNSVGE